MEYPIKTLLIFTSFFLFYTSGIASAQDLSSVKNLQLKPKYRMAQIIRYNADHFVMVVMNNPSVGENQSVVVINKDGQQVFFCSPQKDIPEASSVSVHDAAVNKNGMVSVIVVAVSTTVQPVSVLMVYDLNSGKLQRLVQLAPISAKSVAVDENNNTWIMGADLVKKNSRRVDYDLIYKFSSEGKLLASYVARSLFANNGFGPQDNEPFNRRKNSIDYPLLFANQAGKVFAWFAGQRTLVELNGEGEILSKAQISEENLKGRFVTSVAIQPNGQVLALLPTGITRLVSGSNLWKPIAYEQSSEVTQMLKVNPTNSIFVIGADSSSIIVRDSNNRIFWLPVTNQ
ncbi:MAG: hypothetical protein AB1757_24585 [Acidobacteriota bacterium]